MVGTSAITFATPETIVFDGSVKMGAIAAFVLQDGH
jgi:hypothetical protein